MDAPLTAKEIAENHEMFVKRSALYREFGVDQEGLRSRLIRLIDADNRSILEIGTGKGLLTAMLGLDFDRVVSIDTDTSGQRIAKLNAAYNGVCEKLTFIKGDAGDLSFADRSFDAVVSAFTFHHLEYPFKVVREMIRVADKQIVISDFTRQGFDVISRVHAHEGRHHEAGYGDFSIVGAFLKENGFKVSMIDDAFQFIYVARRI